MSRRKIFIDTDAGTDDVVAIIMALRSADVEVMGISCVGGNTSVDQVAQNVLYICDQLNENIPVFIGAEKPKSRTLKSSDFIHGKDGLGDLEIDNHGREPSMISAIDGLRYCVQRYPQEITVVTLGPMTNLAEAIQAYPELEDQIGTILIMGGTYQMPGNITPVAEYNFWADPESAQYCLRLSTDKKIVGWDITLDSGYLTLSELEELKTCNSTLAPVVFDMQQIRLDWMRSEGQELKCTWADAAAMASLLSPKYVENIGSYYCDVSLAPDDDDTRGMLIVDINHQKKLAANTELVLAANRDIFKQLIYRSFSTGKMTLV